MENVHHEGGAPSLEPNSPSPCVSGITLSEIPINRHECFRVDITPRNGKPVVTISRWKHTPDGPRRTGQAFEFGGHRLAMVTKLLVAAAASLDEIAPNKEARNEAP